MRKSFKIVVIIGLCFVGLSAFFVFMPAVMNTGVIGTYLPSSKTADPYFSTFTLKANNVVHLTYSSTNKTEDLKWYARCDGERTSIYFVFANKTEIQLNLLSSNELKDIYHNNDIYYKK